MSGSCRVAVADMIAFFRLPIPPGLAALGVRNKCFSNMTMLKVNWSMDKVCFPREGSRLRVACLDPTCLENWIVVSYSLQHSHVSLTESRCTRAKTFFCFVHAATLAPLEGCLLFGAACALEVSNTLVAELSLCHRSTNGLTNRVARMSIDQ